MSEILENPIKNLSGCTNCGTTGCNKLNVFNWLSDMVLPPGQKPFDVVEVRFKGSRKDFYRNVNNLQLKCGDIVAVEGTPGHDIGIVSVVGELVKLQLKKNNIDPHSEQIKILYRTAKPGDIEKWNEAKALELKTMYDTRKLADELGLSMKLSDVEYQGDGKKAIFYYTAEGRVDYRELIKRMTSKFNIKVEMKQIGMRQEASRLGGIGSCGRELCCSTWLTDFKVVQTSAARYQNLSINQAKLAGQCGKLKCCLNYELDCYIDAIKDLPDSGIHLESKLGKAKHIKTDIFRRIMWYAYDANLSSDVEVQYNASDKWMSLSAERVKEIIELNKQGIKPDDLLVVEKSNAAPKRTEFADVVGQDSISRMDKKKKKKRKKPNKTGQPKGTNKPQQ